jgi:hypothetical protein
MNIFSKFGRKPVADSHHAQPKEAPLVERLKLSAIELSERIGRLDPKVKHPSSSQESKDLFPMGGIIYRNSAESARGEPIGRLSEREDKTKHRYNLEYAELDEQVLVREITAAHSRGEETYIRFKNSGEAELLIVKLVADGRGQ